MQERTQRESFPDPSLDALLSPFTICKDHSCIILAGLNTGIIIMIIMIIMIIIIITIGNNDNDNNNNNKVTTIYLPLLFLAGDSLEGSN